MAPVSDRIYFPPLEECLTGDRVLLSWKLLAAALTDGAGKRQTSDVVIDFFDDDYIHGLLKSPLTVFAPPSDATKADYQTKTAPINVTSASNEQYGINAVKEDAEWLSENANINLVAALRLVVVEFQSRQSRHLAGPLSSQDANNLQDAAGLSGGKGLSYMADFGASSARDAEELWSDFSTPGSRKRRLFDTYLSERRCFMMIADYAHSLKIYSCLPVFRPVPTNLAQVYRLAMAPQNMEDPDSLIPSYLLVLTDCMTRMDAGFTSVIRDKLLHADDTELSWIKTNLSEIVHVLSIVFQLADSYQNNFPPAQVVGQWFSMMEAYSFFDVVQSGMDDAITELIRPLNTLTAAVSIALLKPAHSLIYLAEREEDTALADDAYDSYLLSSDVLEQIHNSIINAASTENAAASSVILAWALILHRMNVSYQSRTEKRDNLLQQNARERFETNDVARPPAGRRNSAGSIFSIESSKFDVFLENSSQPRDFQVAEQLAALVTSRGLAFEVMATMVSELGPSLQGSMTPLLSSRVRCAFLEVLKVSHPVIGYQSEPVGALLSVLTTERGCWHESQAGNFNAEQDVISCMIYDDDAMDFFFRQALDRFPFESLPFLVMCRVLSSATNLRRDDERADLILELLKQTPTITFHLPPSFQEYELVQEDENTNSFRLLEDLPLISQSSSRNMRQHEDIFRIPAGTYGRFVSDTGRVALMSHRHSSLSLLARQLEIFLAPAAYHTELSTLQADEAAEVISLFAVLLRTHALRTSDSSSARSVVRQDDDLLFELSKQLSPGKDILTVVCEVMDYFLQDDADSTEQNAVSILTACVQFLNSALNFHPSRIWSYLSQSELLGSDSAAGKLNKVVGSLDLVSENFDFLLSSLHFFSELIDTTVSSAVHRRAGNTSLNSRIYDSDPWLGTSEKVLIKTCNSIARVSVDIFENTSTWKFSSRDSRLHLIGTVVPILNKVLHYCYGMGSSPHSDNLTTCLRPAALYIFGCFMSTSTGTLRFQPLLSSMISVFTMTDSTIYPKRSEIAQSQLVSILKFSTTLLRTARYLDQPSTSMETYLFKISTLLARLCAFADEICQPAVELLATLVDSAGKSSNEPLSLLGYLGSQVAKSFLQFLSGLDKPFSQVQVVKTIWKFFSLVLRNRQQWMSNCLLTGQTPREAMRKENRGGEVAPGSVFANALTKLKRLNALDRADALAVLEFVSSAQNFWPWTVFTLQKDTSYLGGLRAFVHELKPSQLTAKVDVVRAAEEARLAAYVAQIFAMQLYHSRHLRSAESLAKELASDLDYYLRDGVEVAGYNNSLHVNFERNFPAKYFGISPDVFKRTPLEPRELGKNFYYNLDYAHKMLQHDQGWLGRKDNGFKAEMELASANLSLVSAQVSLFKDWRFLLLELSTCLPGNNSVQRQMLQVTQQCLKANQYMQTEGAIFETLSRDRADLSLVLIQRLAQETLPSREVVHLLDALVGSIKAVDNPYGPESISYYRTLERALFVTIRAYQGGDGDGKSGPNTGVDHGDLSASVCQTVLNILDHVVGRGFRSLVSLIHDRDSTVTPEDLVLLTAILQACISLPGVDQTQAQILNILAAHHVTYAATALFSWADRFAENGDPVYGELSILFLLELSTLPLVAEQMACDGILGSLLSSSLIKFMRQSSVSDYAESPLAQRCYSIWTKGLLPFMLNLLGSLGATVASEVAVVLNEFPHLLRASVERFEAPGASRTKSKLEQPYITLLSTSEIHSLALLVRVLAALRASNGRDTPRVDWDATGLLENVEFWLSSKRLLKERLMPVGERQMEWRSTKSTGLQGGADNLLQDKVVAQLEMVRDALLSEELEAA